MGNSFPARHCVGRRPAQLLFAARAAAACGRRWRYPKHPPETVTGTGPRGRPARPQGKQADSPGRVRPEAEHRPKAAEKRLYINAEEQSMQRMYKTSASAER